MGDRRVVVGKLGGDEGLDEGEFGGREVGLNIWDGVRGELLWRGSVSHTGKGVVKNVGGERHSSGGEGVS